MNSNQWLWLTEAIIHVSHQVRRVELRQQRMEGKLDILLKNSKVDFSKEDKLVLSEIEKAKSETKDIKAAIERIPPEIPPEPHRS